MAREKTGRLRKGLSAFAARMRQSRWAARLAAVQSSIRSWRTPTTFASYYAARKANCRYWASREVSPESQAILTIINGREHRGIVVYPEAVRWEPLQRPQHLLRMLGEMGYLCFFCESYAGHFSVEEKYPNLFLVLGEPFLLRVLLDRRVIVLCSWVGTTAFIDCLAEKTVWYDVLDRLDFFSMHDGDAERRHQEVLGAAQIVTYSAQKLAPYVAGRPDAILLPNGVYSEDFLGNTGHRPETAMEAVLKSGKPIIGYYGAMEHWFDLELLTRVATEHQEWEFVLIGKAGVDLCGLTSLGNVQVLGQVPYGDLPAYARHFSVAIIPFLVNPTTDAVSPVKFFEYCALGLPVVSTPIFELQQYDDRYVRLASGPDEFARMIGVGLHDTTDENARAQRLAFAAEHHWRNRAMVVERELTRRHIRQ